MEQGKCELVSDFSWTTEDGRTIRRSLAEEWRNYANWYGYHRTRMKVGKAAAGEAFSQLPGDYRVGYMNLATGIKGIELPIPVNSDGGRFRDKPGVSSNRSAWFSRLYGERATQTMTVLHTALQNVGDYFSRSDADGPWGPGNPSQQAACRQNHVIVASNGFWETPPRHYRPVGDIDGTPGEEIHGPDGRRYRYQPGPPYSDKYTNTLADLVMHYWKNACVRICPTTSPRPMPIRHSGSTWWCRPFPSPIKATSPPPICPCSVPGRSPGMTRMSPRTGHIGWMTCSTQPSIVAACSSAPSIPRIW